MDRRRVGEVHFDSSLIDTYISMNARFARIARLIVPNISERARERGGGEGKEKEREISFGEVCRQLESLRMATTRDRGEPRRGSEGKKV